MALTPDEQAELAQLEGEVGHHADHLLMKGKAKPSFHEILEHLQDVPGFDGALTGQGKFPDTGRRSSGPGEGFDSMFGAPARAGLDAMATQPAPRDAFDYGPALWNTLKSMASHFGKDPRNAPSGYDVANHLGIENPYLGTAVATMADLAQLPVGGIPGIAGEIKGVKNAGKIADAAEAFAARAAEKPSVETRIAQMYGQTGDVRDAVPNLLNRSVDELPYKHFNKFAKEAEQAGYDIHGHLGQKPAIYSTRTAYDNPRNAPPTVTDTVFKPPQKSAAYEYGPAAPDGHLTNGELDKISKRVDEINKHFDDPSLPDDVHENLQRELDQHVSVLEEFQKVARAKEQAANPQSRVPGKYTIEDKNVIKPTGDVMLGPDRDKILQEKYAAKEKARNEEYAQKQAMREKGATDRAKSLEQEIEDARQSHEDYQTGDGADEYHYYMLEDKSRLRDFPGLDKNHDLHPIFEKALNAGVPEEKLVDLIRKHSSVETHGIYHPNNHLGSIPLGEQEIQMDGLDDKLAKLSPEEREYLYHKQGIRPDKNSDYFYHSMDDTVHYLMPDVDKIERETNKLIKKQPPGPRKLSGMAGITPSAAAPLATAAAAQQNGREPQSTGALTPAEQKELAELEGKYGHMVPQEEQGHGLLGGIRDIDSGIGKFLAKSKLPPLVALNMLKNTEVGQKAQGYLGGLARTGLAAATGQAGLEDAKGAIKGEAPSSAEYYKRAGVPSGPSVSVPLAKELIGHDANVSARDALGFVTDMLTDPLMYAAAKAAHGMPNPAEFADSLPAKAKALAESFKIPEKEAADKIREAAARLGIQPTAGMLKDSDVVQGLESSLHQSPTLGGMLVRRETAPVAKGMANATKEVLKDASDASKVELGDVAKQQIADAVKSKFKGAQTTFQDLANYTKDIPATDASIKAVSRNIMNIPEVKTFDIPAAKQVVKVLENNPSADQIKQLRTMIGKRAESMTIDETERSALNQIYQKLGRLEENTITRGVLSSARSQPEGDTIAKGMIGELRGAKKAWASGMSDIKDVADNARLGKVKNPDAFVDKIDSIRSEDIHDKLLNTADSRLAESIKMNFPQAYMTMRSAKLGALANRAKTAAGEYIPEKLLSDTQKYTPEALQNLFHSDAAKLADMRTVNASLPDMVGPSGTPKGMAYLGAANPMRQVSDLARYAGYKAMSSDFLQELAAKVAEMPEGKALATKNPKMFNALVYELAQKHGDMPAALPAAADNEPKGKDKWANDGFDKLIEHAKDDQTKAMLKKARADLMASPKMRELLIKASDLKPGTTAMNKVLSQIQGAN